MLNSQNFIPIGEVDKDLIFLKDGSVSTIISVSAVNFALLFETEQISIIDSFAGLLNSLSFPIQIVIYSKILDVSAYLHVIDRAMSKQTNPLLKKMTVGYRQFVERSIRDNNVLDKKFYVCVKATPLELGLLGLNHEEKIKKAQTFLSPKKDHLMRQFGRLGLKSKVLESEALIKLFYEIYNATDDQAVGGSLVVDRESPEASNNTQAPITKLQETNIQNSQPPVVMPQPPAPISKPLTTNSQPQTPPPIPRPIKTTLTTPTPQPQPQPQIQLQSQPAYTANMSGPFIVEELPDET